MITPPHKSASSGFTLPTVKAFRSYLSPTSSPASASSASIFSSDALSSQSSAPSSIKSAPQSTWDDESLSDSGRHRTFNLSGSPRSVASNGQGISDQSVKLASELGRHPRRTQSHAQQDEIRPPPTLVRQSDRKDDFVESLVDTTVQMIEVIWPLSTMRCDAGKNLISLRLFIQEVLKRSKTSYSTLQVALYYLVLIKSCLPNIDFTQEQLEDTHAARAMQCGRRMFLAALILASKYLQDRNYSARAWSKISGLKVAEINSNELAFLAAVRWKLHLPESLFTRWTEVVLKYSLLPRSCSGRRPQEWKLIVAQLTPDLDRTDFSHAKTSNLPSLLRPCLFRNAIATHSAPSVRSSSVSMAPPSTSLHGHNMPASPRIPQLVTPALTPALSMAPSTFGAPAACANGSNFVRCMSGAMREIEKAALHALTLEPWSSTSNPLLGRSTSISGSSRRRSSILASDSFISSPDSMISDSTSDSSRSSSIASVVSSTCALQQPISWAVSASRQNTSEMRVPCATMKKKQINDIPAPWDADYMQSLPQSYGYRESYLRSGVGLPIIRRMAPVSSAQSLHGDLESSRMENCNSSTPRPNRLERKRERPLSLIDASNVQLAVQDNLKSTLSDLTNRYNAPASTSRTARLDSVMRDPRLATSFVLCDNAPVVLGESCSSHAPHTRKRTKCVDDARCTMNASLGPWGAVS